jgi:hypothetical protein
MSDGKCKQPDTQFIARTLVNMSSSGPSWGAINKKRKEWQVYCHYSGMIEWPSMAYQKMYVYGTFAMAYYEMAYHCPHHIVRTMLAHKACTPKIHPLITQVPKNSGYCILQGFLLQA